MSDILELASKLRDTEQGLARVRRAIADNPGRSSLVLSADSLLKRQRQLEEEFARLSDTRWLDVCSYRVFSDDGAPPTIRAVVNVLGDFQETFTAVFDSIKNGPRERVRPSPEVVQASTFGFGYSYSGSLGVVLTLPNERLLVDESDLDRAMAAVFEMARCRSSDQVTAFAKQLGRGPVRKMYRWAEHHVLSGLGADIDWRRKDQVRAGLFVQRPELQSLQQAILETGDQIEEEVAFPAQLLGADVTTHSFRLKLEDGTEVRGKAAVGTIGMEHTVELPQRYHARLRKTTIVNYALDDELVEYFLLALGPPR